MAPAVPSSTCSYSRDVPKENGGVEIDWDNLGFNLTPIDYMYVMKCREGNEFDKGQLVPYGNIELSPASVVLNYGPGLFEGLKAHRRGDGKLVLFRPDQNTARMQIGANRMCMPSPSIDQFIDAVKHTVLANRGWIPPSGKGSLYIRPLLIGTGSSLGIKPVEERMVELQELLEADESFCTGTAVVVSSVGSITYKGKRFEYKTENSVCKKLLSTYVGIQNGQIEDKRAWIVEINSNYPLMRWSQM